MSDQELPDEHFTVTEFIPPTNGPLGTLQPMTIFQLLQEGASLMTERKDSTSPEVALVAHVTSVFKTPSGASFTLEDGTGRISADKDLAHLTHQGKMSAEAEEEEIYWFHTFEHAYVEVIAALKKSSTKWKPRIKINSIHLVQGYHQVMYHTLHVIHNSMLSQQVPQPYDSDQDFRSSEGIDSISMDHGEAGQNDTSIQHHVICAIPVLPSILPNAFSPQKHQPYATLKPLERAIMKHVHRNGPILVADLAQAVKDSSVYTGSQINLALQSLLSEAYITSPLDNGYVVVTPRH